MVCVWSNCSKRANFVTSNMYQDLVNQVPSEGKDGSTETQLGIISELRRAPVGISHFRKCNPVIVQ